MVSNLSVNAKPTWGFRCHLQLPPSPVLFSPRPPAGVALRHALLESAKPTIVLQVVLS